MSNTTLIAGLQNAGKRVSDSSGFKSRCEFCQKKKQHEIGLSPSVRQYYAVSVQNIKSRQYKDITLTVQANTLILQIKGLLFFQLLLMSICTVGTVGTSKTVFQDAPLKRKHIIIFPEVRKNDAIDYWIKNRLI